MDFYIFHMQLKKYGDKNYSFILIQRILDLEEEKNVNRIN